ncbi:hypothetical protein ACIQ34_10840 [Ureibacillus sp. NPDC094379]
MKKYLMIMSSLLVILLFFSPTEGQAKSNAITLTTKDLTFWSIQPNESVESAMNKITKRYPSLEFSQSGKDFYTGDPTQNMNYFLEFYTDGKERTIGVLYEQFNVKKKGLPFTTSKGIKIGSTLEKVREKYGKTNYTETKSSDPGYNYVNFTYPIVLKETKQKGKLTFKMEYPLKGKKYAAKVYGVEYLFEPLKDKNTTDNSSFQSIFGGDPSGKFNGVTIKSGMTKKQVLKLIGEPNEIKEAFGGTESERALFRSAYGTDMFNLLDNEQWTYMRMLDYGTYEATIIFFNYKDVVNEVLPFQ